VRQAVEDITGSPGGAAGVTQNISIGQQYNQLPQDRANLPGKQQAALDAIKQ